MIGKAYNKFSDLSNTKKATLWFLFIDILQKGISLLTIPIFTRLLTPDQFGIFSLYQSWVTIFTIICTLYLWAGAFNNGMIKFESDRDNFIGALQLLITFITGAIFAISLIFNEQFNNLTELSMFLMFTLFVQILFYSSFTLWYSKQRFEYKYKWALIVSLVVAILNPLLGIALIYFSEEKGLARIVSVVIVQVIVGVVFYFYNFYKSKKRFIPLYWRYILVVNIPLIPYFLSQVLLNQADLIMIDKYIGAFETGIYSISYSISSVLLIVTASLGTSLMPWTYANIKSQNYSLIKKNSNLVIVAVAIMTLTIIITAPELLRLVTSIEYISSIWIIPPMVLSIFFIFIASLFINVEIYFEKSNFIMWISIGIALLNIVLNMITLPVYGYLLTAYTTLFCYILNMSIHYIYMKKLLKSKGIVEKLYDIKFILIISTNLFFFTFIILKLYETILLRYIVVLIIFVFIYKKIRVLILKLKESSLYTKGV